MVIGKKMKTKTIFLVVMLSGGLVFGQGNYSKISQSNDGNSAEINQTGVLNQVGDPSNTSEGGVVQSGLSNDITITQSGDFNKVSQFRPEKGVTNAVIQNGESNSAIIEQMNGGQIVGLRTYAYHPGLEQQGNSNHAEIYQSGGSGNQVGELFQHGESNQAYINQVGEENYANLHQRGNGQENLSVIQQDGTGNDAGDVAVNGNNNTTAVIQGFSVILPTKSSGLEGNSESPFGSSDNNQATQWINGTGNESAIFQGGIGDNQAFQHLPSTYYGTGNWLIITQEGAGNNASQYIGGNGNNSLILQSGPSNDASVNSVGDLNQSTIIQGN